eukprot:16126-Heterococcus_DN1.PRE.1
MSYFLCFDAAGCTVQQVLCIANCGIKHIADVVLVHQRRATDRSHRRTAFYIKKLATQGFDTLDARPVYDKDS